MERELVSIEEAAARSGVSPEQIRARIESGGLASTTVESEGRSEVRVALDEIMPPSGRARRARKPSPSRSHVAAPKKPRRTRSAGADGAAPGSTDGSVASFDPGAALSITPEVRALASGLADELFQRWELAMQRRFEDELKLRLQSELEHRQHQAADLMEEVDQRAKGLFGPGGRRIVGMTDRYATWERERTLIRQQREAAEMKRQMEEMRLRLRELGVDPDQSTLTVESTGAEREDEAAPGSAPHK